MAAICLKPSSVDGDLSSGSDASALSGIGGRQLSSGAVSHIWQQSKSEQWFFYSNIKDLGREELDPLLSSFICPSNEKTHPIFILKTSIWKIL